MKEVTGKGFIKGFNWALYPEAEKFLQKQIKHFLKNHTLANDISKRLPKETSTQLIDFIDHMVLTETTEKELIKLGFKKSEMKACGMPVFKHVHSIFFSIILGDKNELALKPEYIDNFVKALGIKTKTAGKPLSPFRYAIIKKEGNYILSAVERRGSQQFVVQNSVDNAAYKNAFKTFNKRKRVFKKDEEGLAYTKKIIQNSLKKLSPSRVADAFFRAERIYWESKNHAGQIQRKRQDTLGVGWGNHDHHTYRASRTHFTDLIEIFEMMGYACRERFFAGERAGWGAQVLENQDCDIVIFADVDITKAEKDKDFAHQGLQPKNKLGTVGLWVGLHGESILQSGMHHLEARFDFDDLRKALPKHNISIMKPFSNFAFLKQAFTEGDLWEVNKKRAQTLLEKELITQNEYQKFITKGAVGSHLENLQRKQGFKGFNQDSVSVILEKTNPRVYKHKGA